MAATLSDSDRAEQDTFTPLPERLYSRVTDPEYAQSFGPPIPSSLVPVTPGSSFKYWVAKDEAWREWRYLRKHLLRHRGKVVDSNLNIPSLIDMQLDILGPWMAGEDKIHAHPTMVLILKNKEDRVKVREQLKSYDKTLEQLPDFGFGWLILPPAREWRRSPATRAQRAVDAFKSYMSSYQLGRAELLKNQTVYEVPGPETERAAKSIAVLSPTASHWILATLGGVIKINNVIFGLTVASAFESRQRQFNVRKERPPRYEQRYPPTPASPIPTETERQPIISTTSKFPSSPPRSSLRTRSPGLRPLEPIEIQEPTSHSSSGFLDIDLETSEQRRPSRNVISAASPTSPQDASLKPLPSSRDASRRRSPGRAPDFSHVKSKTTFMTGQKLGHVPETFMLNEEHGWALVTIDPPKPLYNIIDVPNGFGETFVPTEWSNDIELEPYAEIWVVTGRGVEIGQSLPERQSLELTDNHLTPVWTVQLTGSRLVPEDRGAWVISASTKMLLGMILEIAGDHAYVSPARDIVKQIAKKLDETAYSGPITLPNWIYYPGKPPYEDSIDEFSSKFDTERERPDYYREKPQSVVGAILKPFRTSKRSQVSRTESIGNRIGKTGTDSLWELRDGAQYEWQKLVPQLNDVIGQTPTKSQYESSPAVVLHGYMMGKSVYEASPTVVIGCSSKSYGQQLRKAIKRSGVLDTTKFKVMTLKDPIEPTRYGESATSRSVAV